MYKKDILGGSLILIEKGDVTKKGVSKNDFVLITGGVAAVIINESTMKALWQALKDEKIGGILRGWEK
jgi:hypothetical protein